MDCTSCKEEIKPGRPVSEAKGLCIRCDHWLQEVEKAKDGRTYVIEGECYCDGGRTSGPYRGFGGRNFQIERNGQIIKCSDLWRAGTVPELFRDRLPDNAKWAQGAEQEWREMPERYYFSVEDWNGDIFYLDEYGQEIADNDAREQALPYDGRGDVEAEADRRTMLWENRTGADAARTTMHSTRKATGRGEGIYES